MAQCSGFQSLGRTGRLAVVADGIKIRDLEAHDLEILGGLCGMDG
jgi:hypothetical protein